jgi:hypothetical protein
MTEVNLLCHILLRHNERSSEDVNRAFSHLKEHGAMEKFHPSLLQQLCAYVHYDQLDENILGELS